MISAKDFFLGPLTGVAAKAAVVVLAGALCFAIRPVCTLSMWRSGRRSAGCGVEANARADVRDVKVVVVDGLAPLLMISSTLRFGADAVRATG